MTELTDDQILSALGRMDQEQKFFEQMNAARAFVRDIITRYKEVAARMPALAKEETRLQASIAGVESRIAETTRAGAIKMRAAHDQLAVELREKIEPLRAAFEEAQARTTAAEKKASEVEATCNASIASNLSAAEQADAKRLSAEAALAKLVNKFVTV